MSTEAQSRRARRFVAAGAVFLVAWGVADLADAGRRVGVALGLYGFVLHTVFGKAYALVPSYFDRDLALPRAPGIHLPLSALGTVGMALRAGDLAPGAVGAAGAVAWALGVGVFVGALVWSVRDNLSGAETGTGDHQSERRPVDRAANALVPVALCYLLGAAYATAAGQVDLLPALVDGYPPRAAHLLAAGGAVVVLLAVGFRLLPRFTVAHPPRGVVAVVVPAGAAGPALIAWGLPAGDVLRVGAALEAVAVVGFAATIAVLLYRTDRWRVGFWGVLAGALAGVAGVGLGVWFAFLKLDFSLVSVHYRLNLLGFLGLTIVGVAYQFYPPGAGQFRGANDRTALVSIGLIAAGLAVEAVATAVEAGTAATVGEAVALLGSLVYAGLLFGLFRDRYG